MVLFLKPSGEVLSCQGTSWYTPRLKTMLGPFATNGKLNRRWAWRLLPRFEGAGRWRTRRFLIYTSPPESQRAPPRAKTVRTVLLALLS